MPNSGFPRARRLAESVKRLVNEWIEQLPADRRLGFVTITDVRVTGDLHHAKVYFTVLDRVGDTIPEDAPEGDPAEVKAATIDSLVASAREARTFVAQRLQLRFAPTLEFLEDDVALSGARIDQLLAGLDIRPDEPPAPDGSGEAQP
jgi:ribosome-binding factor A